LYDPGNAPDFGGKEQTMPQYSFGSGVLWGTQLSDAAGAVIANPTPVKFGVLQEASLDISFESKMLYGQSQFPVAVGRGKGKVTGKAKAAQINGALWNSIVFGQTLAAGIVSAVDNSSNVIPSTPYQITVAPPNSGTFQNDLGVIDGTTGIPYTRVAALPATGQYSVSAGGQYTFAAADTAKTVLISYSYTATSASAKKSTISNQLMGYAPTFRADLYVPYQAKSLIVTMNKCIASKLAMATKQEDFIVPEFDWEAFADDAGNILSYATSE
jgi:hypothetical protein